ncbi:hypothetical protein, unlikely [Trypanosoma brucei gambiense DAL972]|uniref:Uncharacterized protein n=1 Tax=Trypanosoma brucei gambiense (strain MHOM/CI/86/DAL972) TaxID=679716 RepID=D0A7C6_TRYB9|nr:hypothetical protein, unlikely [Trypanosoma brucei gambiense DAL972]CBH17577.1 hypothetical protein, unlikely [Trypanosoma brucei gambiense DAL972]|eukprot:XP_011779841.1 hypothetical protein, unlikely [Trypanosoma brucei gambiense DAL972]
MLQTYTHWGHLCEGGERTPFRPVFVHSSVFFSTNNNAKRLKTDEACVKIQVFNMSSFSHRMRIYIYIYTSHSNRFKYNGEYKTKTGEALQCLTTVIRCRS